MSDYLRRSDAAKYLRENFGLPCSTGTLANYAVNNIGPEFSLAGRFPIYSKNALDAWAENRIRDRPCKASG